MYKYAFIVAGIVISGAFWSCSSNEEAVRESEDEVFAIHDEVMAKFGTMIKLQKQMQQHLASLDSLKATESAAATLRLDENRDQALRISHDLRAADSLMSYWMDHYKTDTVAKISSDEALKYLAEQKDQIIDVKAKYYASLDEATRFLGKK